MDQRGENRGFKRLLEQQARSATFGPRDGGLDRLKSGQQQGQTVAFAQRFQSCDPGAEAGQILEHHRRAQAEPGEPDQQVEGDPCRPAFALRLCGRRAWRGDGR